MGDTSDEAPRLTVVGHRHPDAVAEPGRAVVRVVGELDASTAPALDAALREALADPTVAVLVIDAEALEFIDSVGIRTVLVAHGEAEARGATLVVDPASTVVRKVFRLAAVSWLTTPRPAPGGAPS